MGALRSQPCLSLQMRVRLSVVLSPPRRFLRKHPFPLPVEPDGSQMELDGSRMEPDGSQMEPDGSQMEPDESRMEPDGSRMGTGWEPDGSRMGAGWEPDGEPDGSRMGAGWEPDGAGWEPDGSQKEGHFGERCQVENYGSKSLPGGRRRSSGGAPVEPRRRRCHEVA